MNQRHPSRPGRPPQQFRSLNATMLYCPDCKQAMPVREKLALYLPSGALYHYACSRCDKVLGKKDSSGSLTAI